jgi:putative endonuclease
LPELRRQLFRATDSTENPAGKIPGVYAAGETQLMSSACEYSIYLVRCQDGSIYTGITTDVARRIEEHESGARGAKYLRGKGPLKLLFQREVGSRSVAARLEHRIKQLPPHVKQDARRLPARITLLLGEVADQ